MGSYRQAIELQPTYYIQLYSMNLHDYDIVVINSSAGKDSLCALFEIKRMAIEQDYPMDRIHVSHQNLGRMEWPGTKELAAQQAELFGWPIHYTQRKESLLDYALRRQKWPSSKQRWCTSDFKRDVGAVLVRRLSKNMSKVLHVFGFRAEESPSRKKKEVLAINKKLTTKSRLVHDYLPIHTWKSTQVWETIRSNNLPYHQAYDLGMPRLSCVFCIFSPFSALVLAGKHNPELLDEYIAVQDEIGHKFRVDLDLHDVKKAVEAGCEETVSDWTM